MITYRLKGFILIVLFLALSSILWASQVAIINGTLSPGTANQIAYYTGTSTIGGDSNFSDNGTTLTYTGTGGIDSPNGPVVGYTNSFFGNLAETPGLQGTAISPGLMASLLYSGTSEVDFWVHHHGTGWPARLVTSYTPSGTGSHVKVSTGMALLDILATGATITQASSEYQPFGLLRFLVDSTGTVSDTSAPGAMQLCTTINGSVPVLGTAASPTTTGMNCITMNNAGNVTFPNITFPTSGVISTPIDYPVGNCGTSQTVSWANGIQQYMTLNNASCAITLSNPVAGPLSLAIYQPGGGGDAVTWVTTIRWAGGSAPNLTATGNAVDWILCRYSNSQYFCDIDKNF